MDSSYSGLVRKERWLHIVPVLFTICRNVAFPKVNVFCSVSKDMVFGQPTVTGIPRLDMLAEWSFPQKLRRRTSMFRLDGALAVRGYLNEIPPLPANIDDIETRITDAIQTVTPDKLTRVWNEFEYRVDVVRAARRRHIEHLCRYVQSMSRQSQCSRVLKAPSRLEGFTRRFHTLSSIHATNTSLAVVPQSPVFVHAKLRSRTLARRPPSKTAGLWVAAGRGASQSHENILAASPDPSKTSSRGGGGGAVTQARCRAARQPDGRCPLFTGFPERGGEKKGGGVHCHSAVQQRHLLDVCFDAIVPKTIDINEETERRASAKQGRVVGWSLALCSNAGSRVLLISMASNYSNVRYCFETSCRAQISGTLREAILTTECTEYMRINSFIASMRKALNWCAVLPSIMCRYETFSGSRTILRYNNGLMHVCTRMFVPKDDLVPECSYLKMTLYPNCNSRRIEYKQPFASARRALWAGDTEQIVLTRMFHPTPLYFMYRLGSDISGEHSCAVFTLNQKSEMAEETDTETFPTAHVLQKIFEGEETNRRAGKYHCLHELLHSYCLHHDVCVPFSCRTRNVTSLTTLPEATIAADRSVVVRRDCRRVSVFWDDHKRDVFQYTAASCISRHSCNETCVGRGSEGYISPQLACSLASAAPACATVVTSVNLRTEGQEARERYGRHEHARLAPRRPYAQGVQCFRRDPVPSGVYLEWGVNPGRGSALRETGFPAGARKVPIIPGHDMKRDPRMERRWNSRAGETGVPREDPLASGIVQRMRTRRVSSPDRRGVEWTHSPAWTSIIGQPQSSRSECEGRNSPHSWLGHVARYLPASRRNDVRVWPPDRSAIIAAHALWQHSSRHFAFLPAAYTCHSTLRRGTTFPSIVANFTGRMSLSAPITIDAEGLVNKRALSPEAKGQRPCSRSSAVNEHTRRTSPPSLLQPSSKQSGRVRGVGNSFDTHGPRMSVELCLHEAEEYPEGGTCSRASGKSEVTKSRSNTNACELRLPLEHSLSGHTLDAFGPIGNYQRQADPITSSQVKRENGR
ncbi:hypothetical protein PR048_033543 [Dryococelus australis]|uniref:Uncharacterized protein n=1 Tax=Dryococelus australis TaxID=614101 RepID=A0ABQ9G0J9_9NEOP|nr:hypothetical protein PR048_033543 [Dryococelus australis]